VSATLNSAQLAVFAEIRGTLRLSPTTTRADALADRERFDGKTTE